MQSLEELIGQTLVFGIPGPRATSADLRLFRETHAGGLILYRINYRSPEQVRSLVRDMEEKLGRRLLVTLDHEGGRVIMFGGGVTVFPDNLALGRAARVDWAAAQGRTEGRELRRLGMDINFSPTADVLTEAYSPNIGIRSYGSDPKLVSRMVAARVRAMQAQGVSGCAKHFPGLGPATLDPHLELPIIELTWREIRRTHLSPFRASMAAGVHLWMSSHPLYPKLEPAPRTPATFSHRLITDLARKELGFRGVMSSDDLEMGALRNLCSMDRAAVLAAKAGHDLLLSCHVADLQRKVFYGLREAYLSGELSLRNLEQAVDRITKLPSFRARRFAPGAPAPEPGGEALARRMAQAGLYIRIGKTPLPLREPALIVFPKLAPLSRKIMIESALTRPASYLRRTLGNAISYRTQFVEIDPTEADIRRAARAARRDAVVFFCYDAHLQPGNLRLLRRLQDGRRLVLALLRDSYDESYASPATTVVTAFGFRQCQIDACLETIFPRP